MAETMAETKLPKQSNETEPPKRKHQDKQNDRYDMKRPKQNHEPAKGRITILSLAYMQAYIVHILHVGLSAVRLSCKTESNAVVFLYDKCLPSRPRFALGPVIIYRLG